MKVIIAGVTGIVLILVMMYYRKQNSMSHELKLEEMRRPQVNVIPHGLANTLVEKLEKISSSFETKIEPKIRKYRLLINSNQRNTVTYTTPTDYQLQLPETIYGMEELSLEKAVFPVPAVAGAIVVYLDNKTTDFNTLRLMKNQDTDDRCFAHFNLPSKNVDAPNETYTILKNETNAYYIAYEGPVQSFRFINVKIRQLLPGGTLAIPDLGGRNHSMEFEIKARVDKTSLTTAEPDLK